MEYGTNVVPASRRERRPNVRRQSAGVRYCLGSPTKNRMQRVMVFVPAAAAADSILEAVDRSRTGSLHHGRNSVMDMMP